MAGCEGHDAGVPSAGRPFPGRPGPRRWGLPGTVADLETCLERSHGDDVSRFPDLTLRVVLSGKVRVAQRFQERFLETWKRGLMSTVIHHARCQVQSGAHRSDCGLLHRDPSAFGASQRAILAIYSSSIGKNSTSRPMCTRSIWEAFTSSLIAASTLARAIPRFCPKSTSCCRVDFF